MNHASPETLQDYAAGALGSGARLAVGLHLKGCARCRHELRRWEALAGGFLEADAGEAMAPNALEKTMARLEAPAAASDRLAEARMLSAGWWIPVGVGLSIKRLKSVADPGERAYLIRAEPGVALPDHGHSGREWITVLTGAFEDRTGRHEVGDLVESGPEERHRPVACAAGTCLCLAVTEGPLKLSGIARLLQPFLGL